MNAFDAKAVGQVALQSVRGLRERLSVLDAEKAEIEALLGEGGRPASPPAKRESAIKTTRSPKKAKATAKLPIRIVPAKNQKPIKQWVKDIFAKSGRMPMGESEVTMTLITEGYATDMEDGDFLTSVYTDAINPLLAEGVIESIGERPHRKYRFAK